MYVLEIVSFWEQFLSSSLVKKKKKTKKLFSVKLFLFYDPKKLKQEERVFSPFSVRRESIQRMNKERIIIENAYREILRTKPKKVVKVCSNFYSHEHKPQNIFAILEMFSIPQKSKLKNYIFC